MTSRVLIMAGGTGGHIFPALAIAEQLRKQGLEVHWLGAKKGMEEQLIPQHEFPLHLIPVSALLGGNIVRKLKFPINLVRSLISARKLIKTLQPEVVVGFGGYASGPGGLIAKLSGIPLVLHEQNAVVGLTNKLLSRVANSVIEAFPGTFDRSVSALALGNPVRQNVIDASKSSVPGAVLNRLLILGGSLGAVQLNELVPAALAEIPADIRPEIRHQAGKDKDQKTAALYKQLNVDAEVFPFIGDIAEAYSWADLIICRSGASTVSELAIMGKPAIFFPYPWHKDRQQFINAEYLARDNAALVIDDSDQSRQLLVDSLKSLINKPEQLTQMAARAKAKGLPNSVSDICRQITDLIPNKRGFGV